MQRLKRRPDRYFILAQRARRLAEDTSGLVAELYQHHAEICESKAAAQEKRCEKTRSGLKPQPD